jgi:hypothetical protein
VAVDDREALPALARLLRGNGKLIPSAGPFYLGLGSFTWWVASLFMIGSTCFVAGTLLAVSDTPATAGIAYFVGSIFFTSAAYGQFLSALNAHNFEHPRWVGRLKDSSDWRASAIQLFGTLCFNISTGFAMIDTLNTGQVNRLVWSPDVFGSIAFLWSSGLVLAAIRASWHGHPRRGLTWASAALNLLGSIFFGISAVGAFVIPENGATFNVAAANGGTMLGAVCFFVAAWLAWPEAQKLAVNEQRG